MDTLATDKEVATYDMLKRVLQNHLAAAHLPLVTAADVVFGSFCELCVLLFMEGRNAQGLVTGDTRHEIAISDLVAQQTGRSNAPCVHARSTLSSRQAWKSVETIQIRSSPGRPLRDCHMPSGVSSMRLAAPMGSIRAETCALCATYWRTCSPMYSSIRVLTP
jgi:hypothetical protein